MRVASPFVWKKKWRILPVGEVHDQPAALAGGHRMNLCFLQQGPWEFESPALRN